MSCTLQTGFFPSSDGKSQSFYQIWVPEQAPRAIVLLSHGMCEYVGRYADFAEYLGSRGFVLCGADHIGHGKTARNTAELGYIPKNGGRGFLREDLHSMEKLARKTFPGLPVFLFGHSMGSFIARYYEEKYAEGLSGFVICGTAGPNPLAAVGKKVASATARMRGGRYGSAARDKLACGNYCSRIRDSESRFAWLSRDPAVVSRYEQDPFCNYLFTAEGFYTLFDLLETVSRRAWFEGYDKKLPTLIIAGSADPVGAYGDGPAEVYRRLDALGVRDLTLRLCPGARHEILNETDGREHAALIADWLDARLPS